MTTKIEIRAALDEQARQFAEANNNHIRHYKDEIEHLKMLLWAAAASQPHGELIIDQREIFAYRRHECGFECQENLRDRAKVIRAVKNLGQLM
jgi:hypothetical protein